MAQPKFLFPNTPYLPTATAAATDAYAGTAAANVLTATEDAYWRPANVTGSKTLTIDLGEPRNVNALGLAGEAMDGATIEVRASTDNFVASDEQIQAPAILTATVNAGWSDLGDGTTYRYWRLIVSTFGSAFRLSWVCLCSSALLPYFEEDWDAESLDVTAEDLVSAEGLYLGTNQSATLRALRLGFGAVTEGEWTVLRSWAGQCLRQRRPFIVVPDSSADEAFFGTVREKKFSAPLTSGMVKPSDLTFQTRAR